MKIIRSNYLNIICENSIEEENVNRLLETFCKRINPKFIENEKKGYFRNKLEKYIKTYKKNKKEFLVYKGNYDIYQKLYDMPFPIEEIDERITSYANIECNAEPRDIEQTNAINTISNSNWGYGILEAIPAAGKSFISIKLASIFKQRTLIIVDMSLLIEQFIETILRFTNVKKEEIGAIRGNKCEISHDKKIIIATSQTLFKNLDVLDTLSDSIGYVIVDEVHVAACQTFQKILPRLKPKYQLGLSGTPNRDDKMEFLIKESIGPILYTVNKQTMIDVGSVIVPTLRPIFLRDDKSFKRYNDNEEVEFRDVVEHYYLHPKAIEKITKLVKYHYDKNDYQLLICKEINVIEAYYGSILKELCGNDLEEKAENERIKLLEELEEDLRLASRQLDLKRDCGSITYARLMKGQLDEKEVRTKLLDKRKKEREKLNKEIENVKNKHWTAFEVVKNHPKYSEIRIITGDDKKEVRDFIIDETNKGNIKILITSMLFDKALSVPRLNVEYLLFSTREIGNTIQRVGRIGRSFEGKTSAIVYDIIYDHYMSFTQFFNKTKCRMMAHRECTKFHHESMSMFIDYLTARFRKTRMYNEKEFLEKYYKKYVIDLN